MSHLIYPEAPLDINDSITKPSRQFKMEVAKVSVYITLFIILYALMLVVGLVLVLTFCYLGIMLVLKIHNLWAILIGAGMIGIGIMVCFFLVKFVFAKKEDKAANLREATEEEFPELFDFVRKVSAEVKTSFPKHIYITTDVNASVSYDSSLKSLFFPVRKNLTIGLGLVNMVNISEFKAILAHEFGHFSQESMRAGSYVYQVNRVIYNLLFDNTGYQILLEKWAGIHGIFAVCANITVKIIACIQWVLQVAYKLINRSYMGLSRQMEFHADAVAAKAAGSNNCISSLRRAEFADAAYDYTINKYNEWVRTGHKATNLFSQQQIAACFIAKAHKLPVVNGLPDLEDMNKVNLSYRRVNVNDQWASHPTRLQREAALNQIGVNGKVYDESSWLLFGNRSAELQSVVTDELYASLQFSEEPKELNDEMFQVQAESAVDRLRCPDFYNEYYDRRLVLLNDIANIKSAEIPDITAFFAENGSLYRRIECLQEDIAVLEAVAKPENGLRYFDLDGRKIDRSDALVTQAILKKELAEMEAALQQNDTMVFAHFNALADDKETHKALYQDFNKLVLVIDDYLEISRTALGKISEAYESRTLGSARLLADEIAQAVENVRGKLVDTLAAINAYGVLQQEIPAEVSALQVNRDPFFSDDGYNSEALNDTWQRIEAIGTWCHDLKYDAQKKLVTVQLEYLRRPHLV